ncbi:hypothetical protein N7454_006271 [Penicillium verhagenii]|nr:hypothetical protein N7454_006271 [Penicillium verhagenii]
MSLPDTKDPDIDSIEDTADPRALKEEAKMAIEKEVPTFPSPMSPSPEKKLPDPIDLYLDTTADGESDCQDLKEETPVVIKKEASKFPSLGSPSPKMKLPDLIEFGTTDDSADPRTLREGIKAVIKERPSTQESSAITLPEHKDDCFASASKGSDSGALKKITDEIEKEDTITQTSRTLADRATVCGSPIEEETEKRIKGVIEEEVKDQINMVGKVQGVVSLQKHVECYYTESLDDSHYTHPLPLDQTWKDSKEAVNEINTFLESYGYCLWAPSPANGSRAVRALKFCPGKPLKLNLSCELDKKRKYRRRRSLVGILKMKCCPFSTLLIQVKDGWRLAQFAEMASHNHGPLPPAVYQIQYALERMRNE